ncbi:MAG: acylphosphatase [Cellulomonadaceae bacterium]|jgi:acylphosphatase|nr:acylphosphatase [Cellulomonadaceae bacterium]
MAVTREQIRFIGRVQGVGFRYTCAALAGRSGVVGWVRNEADGSVLAEMQGEPSSIEALLAGLAQSRFIRIDHTDRSPLSVKPGDQGFRIARG